MNRTIQRTTAELARTRYAAFEEAFRYAAIGMALVGLDGSWLRVNPALSVLTGYSEKELLDKTFQDITHPDDLENDLQHLRRLVRDEIPYYHIEKRYFRKSQSMIWIMLSVSAVRNETSEPLYFVAQIQDITDRKILEERLSNLAYHDNVTGLSSRTAFLDRLEAALAKSDRAGTGIALLYLDLDKFKTVNDTLGHSSGDELLRAVAGRITNSLKSGSSSAARFGGDEFCVLLENISTEQEAQTVARRLSSKLENPYVINERILTLPVTASIGLAFREPQQNLSAEQLIKEADSDMYRAKKRSS